MKGFVHFRLVKLKQQYFLAPNAGDLIGSGSVLQTKIRNIVESVVEEMGGKYARGNAYFFGGFNADLRREENEFRIYNRCGVEFTKPAIIRITGRLKK